MKSIRGVFLFMNDNYEEINTFLKTQKNVKTNILKERVRATQQKEEETGETSCREKILSQNCQDFIIPNYRSDQELVYPKSRQIALSQGYLLRLAEFASENERTRKVFEDIRTQLQEDIENGSKK